MVAEDLRRDRRPRGGVHRALRTHLSAHRAALPRPQGRLPFVVREAALGPSLHVLDLLAQPLHLRLRSEDEVRDAALARLRSGRVELAVDLLEEELDPLPERTALPQRRRQRREVTLEAD